MVLDTETTGLDTNVCSPVQLAAVIIDPRTLTLVDDHFESFMKPNFDTVQQSTLEWHAKREKTSTDNVLKKWETYPDPSVVWPKFMSFVKKYHSSQDRQTKYSAPIAAGTNIIYYDLPILDRYNDMYGKVSGKTKPFYHSRDRIDLLHWFFPWFESNAEVTSFAMDNMREYFGIDATNAHDALKDVQDCAQLIIKFLTIYREFSKKVRFKGAFSVKI